MNLLFVIDHLGPAGAQRQLVTLGTGLKSRGHEVEFFLYYPHNDHFLETLESSGIPVHIAQKRSKWDTRPPVELGQLVRKGKYHVAISFLTTPNIYNVLATLKTNTKSVVSERSAFPFERVPTPVRLRMSMYRLADHIVVNSMHHHRRLCLEFPWMTDKSSAITNGVDLSRFAPAGIAADSKSEDADCILAVGSINAGKNFKNLIEALKIYQTTYQEPLKIRWAGRDPVLQTDIDAYREARETIQTLGLADSWEWLGVRPDIPALLNQHDAFIHPSLFEGLPNAVCEALAAGKPVLASDVCDHPWLVTEGQTGFLFDPLDPVDIANSIRRFVLLPSDKRQRMARNARAFAEEKLAVDVFVDAYEQLFDSIRS